MEFETGTHPIVFPNHEQIAEFANFLSRLDQQESQQGEARAEEAETGPDPHPDLDKLLVLPGEENVDATLGHALVRPVDVVVVAGPGNAGTFARVGLTQREGYSL